MWFAYYSRVNDCTSRTIQQLPAGRSEEVMPSLPPILSCATDFTDVGEGKVQGEEPPQYSIQQQFNKSSFIGLLSRNLKVHTIASTRLSFTELH